MLEIRSLTKNYGPKKVLVDISFDVKPGEIVALLGKNGAGKSTTMNCVAGITHPTSGDILFDGESVLPESDARARMGILITAVFLDYLNVQANLECLLRAHGYTDRADIRRRIDHILEMVDLTGQKRKLVKTFSFGMKQRLGLAQALMHDADFLMLDEPLVGLDPVGRELVKSTLVREAKDRNKAVLFSSHDLPDVADVCDRIVMIKDGLVAFDGPYADDREIEITTQRPLTASGIGIGTFEQTDRGAIVRDVADLNRLISAGAFDGNPITDVRVRESSLLRLFTE